ncbi:Ig-like domain-containing protein [Nocardioides sp. LHG3406-4]|uniref:Ig-like domain-containing protein n=1 Tax=Nocardioides sp. LHG3406-4 TaxID=2804575 RepID=UPI003CEBC0DA
MSAGQGVQARRIVASALTALAVGVGVVGPGAVSMAAAAVSSPNGLSVDRLNASTPILGWSRVSGATGYQVQVDDDSGFGSTEFNASTKNTRAVPTEALKSGKNFWRVRATGSGGSSGWSAGSFDVSPVDVPVPTAPANGASLPQPQSPPLLRWETSQGATSYIVEVDGDSDFIGARSYTTKTTSLVVPDPLGAGDYFWRVTAIKTSSLRSVPSSPVSFVIQPLATPVLSFPIDSADYLIEDVVLDWQPVPGAAAYDLQVALDAGFNNVTLSLTNVESTRYSPPTTLANDQFWWRVRAKDLAGQPTPWAQSVNNFKRAWPDQVQPLYPLGATTQGAPYFQWTPAQHASHYELYVSTDPNFNNNVSSCDVAGTTYVPRGAGGSECRFPPPDTTYYWRVRPIDLPYPGGGLPGIFSSTQAFTWNGPNPPGTMVDVNAPITGHKVALTGAGSDDPAKGCKAVTCPALRATPVLSWDPMPGAAEYRVFFAQDENFTTSEIRNPIRTAYSRLALKLSDEVSALPESQAGKPYFWYVQPCDAFDNCGPTPVSQPAPLPGTVSFVKASPAVTGLAANNVAGHDVTFTWDDYLASNLANGSMGEAGIQTALDYHVQVDDEPSFSAPYVDEKYVDQTTYTAYDDLYPERTLYVRVQARDSEKNGLTWSPTVTFTKSSPPVALQSPVGGAAVAGTTPFEWAPQAFASSYTVEVYRNNDQAFSPASKVFGTTVKNASYAWNQPIPADGSAYVWRVRATDSSGNVGPWSATGSFVSRGTAPELLGPGPGARLSGTAALFRWSDVVGAASYSLQVRAASGSTSTFKTVATAYAPSSLATGDYTWTVTALDAADKPLGTSAGRALSLDSTAPKVVKFTPKKLKPKSTIKIMFSEKVVGASAKTVKLYLETKSKSKKSKQKAKAIKATVKMLKPGNGLTLKPKKKLKPGSYFVSLNSAAIRDGAGNPLTESKLTSKIR